MRRRSLRRTAPLLALAAIVLAACSERRDSNAPSPLNANPLIVCGDECGGGGGGGGSPPPPPPPPPPPSITSLSLPTPFLEINAGSSTYTATIYNGRPAMSGVVAQGYVVQNPASRAAGGALIDCHAGLGVLPNGTCTISYSLVANNSLAGNGTLVPGTATFELDLILPSGKVSSTAYLDLVPGLLSATGTQTLAIGGSAGALTVSVQNTGTFAQTALDYEATIVQGVTRRLAGTAGLTCGTVEFVLPAQTICTQTMSLSASNSASGSGTLVAGAATLELVLEQGTSAIAVRRYPITLTGP